MNSPLPAKIGPTGYFTQGTDHLNPLYLLVELVNNIHISGFNPIGELTCGDQYLSSSINKTLNMTVCISLFWGHLFKNIYFV